MLDLTKLRTFIHAAEQLSFSAAGKQLHLTQPTISHHIKVLEESLGVALFLRSGHRLKLTEAGRALLPLAHKLVHQAFELQEIMGSIQQKATGHLRIACSSTSSKYVLPQLAARFVTQYPGIQVTIQNCAQEMVFPELQEEEANLAVVSSCEFCDDGFECKEFFTDFITLIVPAGHRWASRSSIEPAELQGEPMIMREPTSGSRRVLLTELSKRGITIKELDILLEIGNAEAIVNAVLAGFGVSFVSTLAASYAFALRQIVAIPVRGLDLQRKVYLVRRTLDNPNRFQGLFWAFVHEHANHDLLQQAGEFV